MCAGLEVSPRSKNCAKRANKSTGNEVNVFKIECCGSFGQLPTEKEMKQKVWRFLSKIVSKKRLLEQKTSLMKAKGRVTKTFRC